MMLFLVRLPGQILRDDQAIGSIMKPEEILHRISEAGAWLPITVAREAFGRHDALAPSLLDAVQQRAAAKHGQDIRAHRLAAFGVFSLAQHRDDRLLDSLICLFETSDPEQQDEWLFSNRLFFFGHRLLAGVCQFDGQKLGELAVDDKLRPATRSLALCAIGLQAAYGDVARAEAVRRLRATYNAVQTLKSEWTDSCWVRTAAKLHSKEFERELQWFLASGRLHPQCRQDVAGAIRTHPDANFLSVMQLDSMVDLFSNVFPQEMRDGEVGLMPNGQIPGLEFYEGSEPSPKRN
jgi:hypothetical protein